MAKIFNFSINGRHIRKYLMIDASNSHRSAKLPIHSIDSTIIHRSPKTIHKVCTLESRCIWVFLSCAHIGRDAACRNNTTTQNGGRAFTSADAGEDGHGIGSSKAYNIHVGMDLVGCRSSKIDWPEMGRVFVAITIIRIMDHVY